MELFVPDILMTELDAELEYRRIKEKVENERVDDPTTAKEEGTVELVTEEMTADKTPEVVTTETEVSATEGVASETPGDIAEVVATEEKPVENIEGVTSEIEVGTTGEVTSEDKPDNTTEEDKQDVVPTETANSEAINNNSSTLCKESSESISPSPLVATPTEMSIKKKDKKCGEYLWMVLTRLVISKSLPLNMTVSFLFLF